ncbi:hypothetical protein Tco_0067589, partial [Tanacetum coccineum]
ISVTLDDITKLVEVRPGRVSSGPNDVVVALSAHEKGDGLDSSSAAAEEAAINPLGGKLTVDVLLSIQRILSHATHPRPNGFPLGTCSIAGQASIVIMEYLVNISKRHAFWNLNDDILKITVLTTNTSYPSRKIRRIRACTRQRPQRKQD